MIANPAEYQKAQEELHDLEARLERLQQAHPIGFKGFTKAGIRKMIAACTKRWPCMRAAKKQDNPIQNESDDWQN